MSLRREKKKQQSADGGKEKGREKGSKRGLFVRTNAAKLRVCVRAFARV